MDRRQFVKISALAFLPMPAFAHDNPMPQELRDAIERQPFSPVLGNTKGDVTLTEFFDYNCPFCKKVPPLLDRLIKEDPNLRIVLREWPVLGESSELAARYSLASMKQGKYLAFHHALMNVQGRLQEASILRAASQVGLDRDKLKRDIESQDVNDHIYQSLDLGDHMGLAGTPTFIAGHDGLFGAQTLDDLRSLVQNARRDLS